MGANIGNKKEGSRLLAAPGDRCLKGGNQDCKVNQFINHHHLLARAYQQHFNQTNY